MTARQQRRAAERLARKNHNFQSQPSTTSSVQPQPQAQRPLPSAAATSAAGTCAEQVAALKVPLLLPGEDAQRYRTHLLYYFEQHTPEAGLESVLVQRLADLQWRLLRIADLEAAIMILGRRKYADLVTEADASVRIALLDAQTLISEGLALKRLHTQETRLRRFYANDLAELTAIQENRQHPKTASDVKPLSFGVMAPPEGSRSIPLTDANGNGFEFSTDYQIDLADESDPADCLEFTFGSEFSCDVLLAGATSEGGE